MDYEYTHIKGNEYLVTIKPEAEDERVETFEVVVFESEDEIDTLVVGYLESKNNLPAPGSGATPIPLEVSMAQCRLALFDKHGIETDAQFYALTDILPEADRPRARLELRTRPTVRYDNQLVIAFCTASNWDRDQLFIYAGGL